MDQVFTLKTLLEKYLETERELYVDGESKACVRVGREGG